MGTDYRCICKSCGYEFDAFLGSGMMGFMVNEEETEKMRLGGYGEKGRKFFEEHPDGKISTDKVVTRCTSCGSLQNSYRFNFLIPRDDNRAAGNESKDSVSGKMQLSEEMLGDGDEDPVEEDAYIVYEKFDHRCDKCGGKAMIIEKFGKKAVNEKITCPECGKKLFVERQILWD